jgi:hypothetical protein
LLRLIRACPQKRQGSEKLLGSALDSGHRFFLFLGGGAAKSF